MTGDPVLILPDDVAESVEFHKAAAGVFEYRGSARERALLITGHSYESPGGPFSWRDKHRWRQDLALWDLVGETAGDGLYYRVAAELNRVQYDVARRDGALALADFRDEVEGWRSPASQTLALTYAPEAEAPWRWRAWLLADEQARPLPMARQLAGLDALLPLHGLWPLDRISEQRVLVLGVGSIGSAACEALLRYGARALTLVDYDHLLPHNFARHRLPPDQLGRLKVSAMADHLRRRDPLADIEAVDLEILTQTDRLRALVREAKAVLVATDGVASRRIANHVTCWALRPTIFACELRNQGVGELVRYRPRATGCLWCLREQLVERGSMDPEPDLDRGYGTGDRHQPTTAVGPDLWLIGEMAAKLTVATLMEREGIVDQRAPGDHAVIGLRPMPDLEEPFDVGRAGEVKWMETAARRADCPSCGEASERAAG